MAYLDPTVANYNNIANTSYQPDFSSASTFNQSVEGPSAIAVYTGGFIMLVTMLVGLAGSIIILAAILQKKDMKNIINIFIASLCINDVINLSLNNAMVIISYFLRCWPSNHLHCELGAHFTVLLMGSSLWHTGLIAIHRFIVVVCNQFYMTISKNCYTAFVLVFARAVPLLFLINPDLGNMVYYEPKLLRCLVKKDFALFKSLVSIVLMIVPSLIVVICYIAIFIKVYVASAALRANHNSEWLRREIQITKMFGMVFLMILIGYIPYGIVRSIDRQLNYSANVYVVFTVLYAVANSVNPIIYGAMDRRINEACRQLLCSSKRQSPRNGLVSVAPNERLTSNKPLVNCKESVTEIVPLQPR